SPNAFRRLPVSRRGPRSPSSRRGAGRDPRRTRRRSCPEAPAWPHLRFLADLSQDSPVRQAVDKMKVELLIEEDCALCEQAREVLESLREDLGLDVTVTDARSDSYLFARHRYD